jgi:hypothetical protein
MLAALYLAFLFELGEQAVSWLDRSAFDLWHYLAVLKEQTPPECHCHSQNCVKSRLKRLGVHLMLELL